MRQGRLTSCLAACLVFGTFALVACRSPGGAPTQGSSDASSAPPPVIDIDLPGVDASQLATREKRDWSALVSELLSPCKDVVAPIATCVKEQRACGACLPAAKFLVERVRRGESKEAAEAMYKARFADSSKVTVEVGTSPWKGVETAPIQIVEWADFQCPHCKLMVGELEALMARFPGKIRVVFKQFPLDGHPAARPAALAAKAAQRQGKFWQLHKLLFENQETLDATNIRKFAADAGLDLAKLDADLASPEVAKAVDDEKAQGEAARLPGTPYLVINGRPFAGTAKEDLEAWVQLELELLSGSAPTPSAAPTASIAASASASPSASASTNGPTTAPSAPPTPKGQGGK